MKQAAQNAVVKKTVEEMKALVASGGEKAQFEIEKRAMDAFAAYKKQNETFTKKAIITQKDKDTLEQMKMQYEAIKTAKTQILDNNTLTLVKEIIRDESVESIQKKIDEVNEELWFKDDKAQEFPDDEMLEAEVEQATEEVKAFEKALVKVINDKSTAVEVTEKVREIQKHTDEKIAYNTMYKEAKNIQKSGDAEEMKLYYSAVKYQFDKAKSNLEKQKKKEKVDFTEK